MATKTYNFYSDPSHGWLKVPRSEIERLGLAPKISSCSYQHGDFVYLEEDCDSSLFIETQTTRNVTVKIKESWTNRSSKIRSYRPYHNEHVHTGKRVPYSAYHECETCGMLFNQEQG